MVGAGPVAVVMDAATGGAWEGGGGVVGDVDGDGQVNETDALVIAAYSVHGVRGGALGGDVDGGRGSMGRMRGCWLCIALIRVIRGCRRGLGCRWRWLVWLGAFRVCWYVGSEVVLTGLDGQVLAETSTGDAGAGFSFAVRPEGLPAWVLVTAVGGVGLGCGWRWVGGSGADGYSGSAAGLGGSGLCGGRAGRWWSIR